MASQVNFPGSVADSGSGTGWINQTNIEANDGAFATCSLTSFGTSKFLQGTNFGFTVPIGATINGIQLEIQKKENIGSISDVTIQLLKAGVPKNFTTSSNTAWTTSSTTAVYGSSTDLWGTTWTSSDINSSSFGAQMDCLDSSGDSPVASVDFYRITVFYTPAPTAGSSVGALFGF